MPKGRTGPERKYSLDREDFFEIIDSPEKAYWLGFIAADGGLRSPEHGGGRRLTLNLSAKDKSHLILLNSVLGSSRPLRRWKSKGPNGGYRLSISSAKMCRDLESHGIIPRKTFSLEPPTGIPSRLNLHFIRGYFDGDGSVYVHKRSGRIRAKITSASLGILEWIQEIVGFGSIRQESNKSTFTLNLSPKRFYEFLYDSGSVYLERKKLVFQMY